MNDRHSDIRELLLPYVLGQLDEPDRSRVQHALADDPALREELAAFEELGARIIGAVEQEPVPAHLKDRVMDLVRASGEPHEAPTPIAKGRTRRPQRRLMLPALTGGLAAACVALAIVSVNLDRELDGRDAQLDRVEQQFRERSGVPAAFEDARPYTVATSGTLERASGTLVQVAPDKWILLFRDVPSPGVGSSWQVWTADSSGSVRNVAQWRTGETQVLVLDRADITEVMVSHEPSTRPAPAPTSAPVAQVKV